jgi:catechol 2,3-dioxygenase-like lactoylglutathione lyase family enzyme
VCPGAVNLNHITLCISDLDRSVAFYRRLGLIQIVADDDYARFVCPDGDSTLSLHCHPGAGPVEDAVSVISLHFETDRLDEVVAELEEQGIRFEQAPIDQPYLWREAILRDPDGHRIFIYHAGVNRLNPPWRLETPAG